MKQKPLNEMTDKEYEKLMKWLDKDAERRDKRRKRRNKRIKMAKEKYHINYCPRCWYIRTALTYSIESNLYQVSCPQCYHSGMESRTIRGAIKKWNKVCEELKKGENQ